MITSMPDGTFSETLNPEQRAAFAAWTLTIDGTVIIEGFSQKQEKALWDAIRYGQERAFVGGWEAAEKGGSL